VLTRDVITISVASLCLVLANCGVNPATSVASKDRSAALTTGSARPQFRTVELATLAHSWISDWTVIGAKTEPTYVEHVRISRRGDRFTLDADALGEQFGRTELSVDDRGRIAVRACPRSARCDVRPTGFLATVQVLAAARRGQLAGRAPVLRYAGRSVACVPADLLWGKAPMTDATVSTMDLHEVLDPCLDILTGAVLAQRSRHDGSFAGPTLDEGTLIVCDLTTRADQRNSGSCPQAGSR